MVVLCKIKEEDFLLWKIKNNTEFGKVELDFSVKLKDQSSIKIKSLNRNNLSVSGVTLLELMEQD